MSTLQLRSIGPKSAAWLRQVGLRSREELLAIAPKTENGYLSVPRVVE